MAIGQGDNAQTVVNMAVLQRARDRRVEPTPMLKRGAPQAPPLHSPDQPADPEGDDGCAGGGDRCWLRRQGVKIAGRPAPPKPEVRRAANRSECGSPAWPRRRTRSSSS
jgi:hypothetical protein